jgi:hypothetical protein
MTAIAAKELKGLHNLAHHFVQGAGAAALQ